MAFHDDPGVREEAPKASGPRFFFRIIAQEAAALLKLNLLFLLFCLPAVTIPPALLALFQVVRRMPAERTVRCWSQFWDAFRHRWSLPSDGPAPDGGRVRGMVLPPLRPG